MTRPPAPARLIALVGEAMNAHIALQAAEAEFRAKREHFRHLTENVIPEYMEAEELEEAILPTGDVVGVKTVTRASITQEHREAAYEYLRANGHDNMIKGQVIIQFGLKEYAHYKSFHAMMQRVFPELPIEVTWVGRPGESDRGVTQSLMELVRSAIGPERKIDTKETVPGATLVSFVKKQLDAGTEFPSDLFGAVRTRQAQIPGLKPVEDPTERLFDAG